MSDRAFSESIRRAARVTIERIVGSWLYQQLSHVDVLRGVLGTFLLVGCGLATFYLGDLQARRVGEERIAELEHKLRHDNYLREQRVTQEFAKGIPANVVCMRLMADRMVWLHTHPELESDRPATLYRGKTRGELHTEYDDWKLRWVERVPHYTSLITEVRSAFRLRSLKTNDTAVPNAASGASSATVGASPGTEDPRERRVGALLRASQSLDSLQAVLDGFFEVQRLASPLVVSVRDTWPDHIPPPAFEEWESVHASIEPKGLERWATQLVGWLESLYEILYADILENLDEALAARATGTEQGGAR